MKSFAIFNVALAVYAGSTVATSVFGAAEGFAKGVTGGGSATAVYPNTIDELVSYLGDDEARVIVLSKTYVVLFTMQLCHLLTTPFQLRFYRLRRHYH
jgi:pectin lyase